MQKILKFIFLLAITSSTNAQLVWQTAVNPEQNQTGTIIFNATGTALAGATGTLYAHTGVKLNGITWKNVIGAWGDNTAQPALTPIGTNLYKLTLTPTIMAYYGVATGSITQINMVVRSADAAVVSADMFVNVGFFELSLLAPVESSTTIWSAGNFNISASNTQGNALYILKDPLGVVVNTVAAASSFSYDITTPINGEYTLTATIDTFIQVKKFSIYINQNAIVSPMPTGLHDGVNYYNNDSTKVTLVLNAPGKDFVYVAGNFNNWTPTSNDVMKKDATTGKFWIDVSNIIPNNWYAFQYWVCDNTPATNSPKVVKTADPFSTLVLSPFDDPEIVALGVYPNLPVYNNIAPNQQREVSVIQTGASAYWQYNWKSTTKPNASIDRKNLITYEVLIRDFDANRTYQDLINRLSYFKNLKINSLQLMPVMEFEGNMSWGYNPMYHLAADKRYGSPAKLKELIDSCHQNGIAVILDIALNHVFHRSPLERMWMIDTDNDGWSDGVSPDNPYCNVVPKHTLNVGTDLNHFNEPNNLTNNYVYRTMVQWIQDFKIDGLRWDLTQGFTNSCTANDYNCTASNQTDRITKLKWYADMQWSIDPNFYIIFEHWVFGEIPIYTNYRLTETPSKGIICWRRADSEFAELIKGNTTDISYTSDPSTYRIQGNLESHDEERIVYKALTETGQTTGNLSKIHSRLPAAGAVFFLVPGPKMFWHFADLGCEQSVNTCNDGTVQGNCRLDTKPQPQWTNSWMVQTPRRKINNDWSKLIGMRINENVFKNGQYSFNQTLGTGRPRLDVWTSTTPTTNLSYVMVHTNFTNSSVTFPAYFPYTGTWYNLMDNTPITVSNTSQNITLPADGGYVVYGNAPITYTNYYITTANGNWNNPATWIGNIVPPPNAQVTIKHNVIITTNTSCNEITVEPTGSVLVNPNISFKVLE